MYDLVVIVEDQLRGRNVRLYTDADRRVDGLIEWYVAHFGLPRRYFDLKPIEYRLVRALDQRRLPGHQTLRNAGIADGELLQLVSRKGRQVWRTTEAVLDEIEQEIRGHIAEETWDWATQKLAEIETTETGGHRVQQVRRLMDEVGGPAKLIDVGDKLGEALGLYRTASSWAKRGLAALMMSGSSMLVVGTLLVCRLSPGPGDCPALPMPTGPAVVTAAPTATNTSAPTATGTPTSTSTPTETPTQTSTTTPTPSPALTITNTSTPACIPRRPAGWVAYIVKRGDTLYSLARSRGTTVAEIQRVNCLPGSIIVRGTRLWLPAVPEPDTTEPRYPDLTVGEFRELEVSCLTVARGCVTRVSFSIVNAGTGAAGGFNIRMVADPDQSVIVNPPVPSLAPGGTQESTITTPLGGNCFDPDCTVCVTVDSSNNVTETNERNNELCTTRIG